MTSGKTDDDRLRGDGKLPRGSHGLPPEFVVRSQRERLFAGLARALERAGYAATTVDDIAVESSVSRKALYTHFSGKEDVLLQAHKSIVERVATGAGPAVAEQSDWRAAMRALFDWSLEFFARQPAFAHLTLVEMPAATNTSREAHDRSLDPVRALIERAVSESEGEVPSVAVDGMLGGLAHVVARIAESGAPADLPCLRPELMAWFALLLEGEEGARREREVEVSISPTYV